MPPKVPKNDIKPVSWAAITDSKSNKTMVVESKKIFPVTDKSKRSVKFKSLSDFDNSKYDYYYLDSKKFVKVRISKLALGKYKFY